MNIIIDTKGQADLLSRDRLVYSDDDLIADFGFETAEGTLQNCEVKTKGKQGITKNETKKKINSKPIENMWLDTEEKKTKVKKICGKTDLDLDAFEKDMGWTSGTQKSNKNKKEAITNIVAEVMKELNPMEKALQKTAIKPGIEQLESLPKRKSRRARRKEREATTGRGWFDLPAPEVTDEVRHDLEIIQMRSVLDPKHFYKKNDAKELPKYFRIGKVMDSPLDYYNSRLTKKERKRTIVDELMADAEFSKYNKRKYKEIVDEKRKTHYKAHRHASKLKGKNKKRK